MKRGPPPLPEGEGVIPNLWGLKVLLDSSVRRQESLFLLADVLFGTTEIPACAGMTTERMFLTNHYYFPITLQY